MGLRQEEKIGIRNRPACFYVDIFFPPSSDQQLNEFQYKNWNKDT